MSAKSKTEGKKKRVSKCTKKSWRKNTDIEDVEEFLDDKRLEERLGAPFSEREDSSLFTIDDSRADGPTEDSIKPRYVKEKPLRCYQNLVPQSAVQDPISKRNRVRTPEEIKQSFTKQRNSRKRKILENEAVGPRPKRTPPSRQKSRYGKNRFTTDLWADDDEKEALSKTGPLQSEWCNKELNLHTLANTGKPLIKPPSDHLKKKLSKIPALEAPHPGMSYNPSFEDHQSLLTMAAEIETKKIKIEEHIERVTTQMFPTRAEAPTPASRLKEMSEGLGIFNDKKEPEEEESNSDTENDEPYHSVNPPVRREDRKLAKKKRRQKEIKLEEQMRKKKKEEKKKLADVDKAKSIVKDLALKEEELAVKKMLRLKSLAARELVKPKVLSRHKYEAPDPEVSLSTEIAGNLRNLKPEGSLLMDRYKSLQKRSIVEPRIKQKMKRKYKQKKFERRSHKMGWEPKGY